jgi:hypothetical protein
MKSSQALIESSPVAESQSLIASGLSVGLAIAAPTGWKVRRASVANMIRMEKSLF